MQKILIGELAKRAGVTPRTVRYYESLGLLGKVDQETNGFHYYGEEALCRLEKIGALKRLGLKLDEIKDVIDLYFVDVLQGKKRTLAILTEHLAETERKIEELQTFKADVMKSIEKVNGFIKELE